MQHPTRAIPPDETTIAVRHSPERGTDVEVHLSPAAARTLKAKVLWLIGVLMAVGAALSW